MNFLTGNLQSQPNLQLNRVKIQYAMWCKRVTLIPPLDLTQQYKQISDELDAAVLQVLASGRYIGGVITETFEQEFAQYMGTEHCIGCNSGTDALFLALRSLHIGAGDEVITTAFSFFASAEVISAVGATPVFVDIDEQTFNLDSNQIAAAITPQTKAIMPVHLFGQPVDMTRVMAIAQAHDLWVIEDCAQSTGATWNGAKVGSIGHIGCFSFYPTKNLGASGDAGAVTTNDATLANTIRQLKNHGQPQQYIHDAIGINSRLDTMQAAILQVKLRYLDRWNLQRQAVAAQYHVLLEPVPGVIRPQTIAGGECVWNQYSIRLPAPVGYNTAIQGNYRDRLRQALKQQGVSSTIYYPVPLHLQPVYTNLGYQIGQLPRSERIAQEVLSLPMFPELSLEQQEQVVYALKDSLAEAEK